jgi:hypothetical protein
MGASTTMQNVGIDLNINNYNFTNPNQLPEKRKTRCRRKIGEGKQQKQCTIK